MTVLQSRRQAWDVIFSDPNLSEQSLQQRGITGTVCEKGLRSVCWKVYLGYLPNLNVSTWSAIQLNERKRYTDLRRQYIEEPAELMTQKNDNLTDNNPLALNESNPWQQYFADSEIRKVIRQDVDRTFPDVDFFRSEAVQEKMTDILFIYCKIHHEVSYRQGMHELLAPFYWNIATESLDGVPSDEIDSYLSDPTNRLMVQVLDPAFVEHDAFLLFDRLMAYAKPWYEFNTTVPAKSLNRRSKSAMDLTAPDNNAQQVPQKKMSERKSHHQCPFFMCALDQLESGGGGLPKDPSSVLTPCRSAIIQALGELWDRASAFWNVMVEFVCLAMLLRLHDQLLENDYAECLTLLMRGTRISTPITLVEQAKYLQGNLSHDGALQILRQNDLRSGKEPRASLWKNDLENAALPDHTLQQHYRKPQGSNLDNITNITRGVMKSSQVRDLNKTIAGVMGTVHKNVNLFGDNVLGRGTDGQSQRRRLTVPSEFPDGIDRVAQSTNQSYSKPPASLPRSSSNSHVQRLATDMASSSSSNGGNNNSALALASIQKVNRQMGELMAQCIDILEKELFSDNSNQQKRTNTSAGATLENATIVPSNDISASAAVETSEHEAQPMENDQAAAVEDETDTIATGTTDNLLTQSDNDNSDDGTKVLDKESSGKAPPVGTSVDQKGGPDEASLTLALAGLKHIRDVLRGRQPQFDSNILDLDLTTPTPATRDTKQATKEQKPSDISKKPLPDLQVKKPSPPYVQQHYPRTTNPDSDEKTTGIDSPITATTPSPTRPVTTPTTTVKNIPTSRPKQQVTYSIEDLLSDPALQSSGSEQHSPSNNKFQWMADNDTAASTDHSSTSVLFNSTGSVRNSAPPSTTMMDDDGLPILGQHRPASRQRSSMTLNKPSAVKVADPSINHVDPLDAKNVDKRYSYEYDIYH
ncbi:hypothetical protein [Absidia glauca]|uniref:Rab-GAP TBC domain-containing protein n=1 Tax=Absidia glauca TaxID=4829 RepID=A0A168SVF7_ABSGL|nr:hypothetical protein [Absidia glauca]